MKNRRNFSLIIYIVLVCALMLWITGMFDAFNTGIPYSQVLSLFEKEQVKRFVVEGNTIDMELHTPLDGRTTVSSHLADEAMFRQDLGTLLQEQTASGVLEYYDFRPTDSFSAYDLVLPLLIVGVVILVIWAFLMSRISGGGGNHLNTFGKARTTLGTPGDKKVTFADVAGADEEKAELQEVVDFLKNPDKFLRIGARIPRGILLVGPPGTGKTLLARAAAGEAGVEFLSISGSDFVEMYVGVGASRVRDLFDQAKKLAPAIIFIDEIDAVGRKRGSGLGGGHDEREQTLNQLLVEMDGFVKSEGVIVMAATNRPDILDPALLRPGRFDRQVMVGKPDAKGREAILRVHAKDKCLDASVDLAAIAMGTAGFTGADLSNLLNEAAIRAARENRPVLTMEDLNEAMMKVYAGPEKRSRAMLQRDLKITAAHEAGHAVAMYFLPTHDPVRQISIVPRGNALGITWSIPREESFHLSRNEMYEQIVGLLGGRVAEELVFQDITTGASNDIERATHLARDMVARYGMSQKLGTVAYLSDDEVFIGRDFEKAKSYSEQVAGTIDAEVKSLIDRAYDHCRRILTENRDKLDKVTAFLLDHEYMSGKQFADCMAGEEPKPETGFHLF